MKTPFPLDLAEGKGNKERIRCKGVAKVDPRRMSRISRRAAAASRDQNRRKTRSGCWHIRHHMLIKGTQPSEDQLRKRLHY